MSQVFKKAKEQGDRNKFFQNQIYLIYFWFDSSCNFIHRTYTKWNDLKITIGLKTSFPSKLELNCGSLMALMVSDAPESRHGMQICNTRGNRVTDRCPFDPYQNSEHGLTTIVGVVCRYQILQVEICFGGN